MSKCKVLGDSSPAHFDKVVDQVLFSQRVRVAKKLFVQDENCNLRMTHPYTIKVTCEGEVKQHKFADCKNLTDYVNRVMTSQFFTRIVVDVNRYCLYKVKNGKNVVQTKR